MNKAKSFSISRETVLAAFKQVKAKGGSAGYDRQSLEDFEKDLKDNLYKIWNRMSSGSYFPPPVLRVGKSVFNIHTGRRSTKSYYPGS